MIKSCQLSVFLSKARSRRRSWAPAPPAAVLLYLLTWSMLLVIKVLNVKVVSGGGYSWLALSKHQGLQFARVGRLWSGSVSMAIAEYAVLPVRI